MPVLFVQEPAAPVSVAYELLASAPPQLFADLVHLAAVSCSATQALVTLAGPGGPVLKAQRGLAAGDLATIYEYCEAVMRAETVVVGNGEQLGPGQPHFFIGVALLGPDDEPLGTLCVFSPTRRPAPDDAQYEALACLARRVADYLAQALKGLQQASAVRPHPTGVSQRPELFVKHDARLLRVLPADVTHFEALGDYVNLYTVRERLTVYGTMKDMQARLPAADFARIHRKYIIRLDRLLALEGDTALLDAGRDGSAHRPATAVPIGNSYKAALLARLQVL